jgi:hypothetical protein
LTLQTTHLSEIRDLATIPVWAKTGPSAASVLGISKSLAYSMAADGELPTIRVGAKRRVVPVQRLLHMLGADNQTA